MSGYRVWSGPLCGPRSEKNVSGVLSDLGYTSEQVYKF
jgi:hypothetical protein